MRIRLIHLAKVLEGDSFLASKLGVAHCEEFQAKEGKDLSPEELQSGISLLLNMKSIPIHEGNEEKLEDVKAHKAD